MKSGMTLIALGVLALFLSGMVSGCSLDEVLTARVRPEAQKNIEEISGEIVPDKVTLREARRLLDRYDDAWKRFSEDKQQEYRQGRSSLAESVADAEVAEQLFIAFGNDSMEVAVPALGTLPMGNILSSLLLSSGTYFLGSRRRKKEDESYDMGREEAIDSLKKAKQ